MTETHNTYVMIGNSALFKCEIPSFVADIVSVVAWVDNEGVSRLSSDSMDGNTTTAKHWIFFFG